MVKIIDCVFIGYAQHSVAYTSVEYKDVTFFRMFYL